MTMLTDGKLRVLVAYGTRPEAIKLAPVVAALRQRSDRCETVLCSTGQHRDLTAQVEELFDLSPDFDLDLMVPEQQLNELTARVVTAMDGVLQESSPDWLLVQGDTTSALGAALAAFHRGVAVGHVEAGLRTGDLARPFPEEANRRLIDTIAEALFAPTARARIRLLAEGVAPERVHLTGNTVVDALRSAIESVGEVPREDEVLITIHRRESFGAPIREIFAAIAELAQRFPNLTWIYPVHPNPQVRRPAQEVLGGAPNVELREPLAYPELVRHLMRACLVLTDSGGIQEEAPSLGTPVLVLRDKTERPEGVAAGVARMVGVRREEIVATCSELLSDAAALSAMSTPASPYGDGRAGERIAAILTGEPWQEFTSQE